MARGGKANVGDTRVAANGYHYTRCEEGWRLTHHLIMEETLGRRLEPDERVIFVDGKRSNLAASNIETREKSRGSIRRRKANIEARIAELQAELAEINEELSKV